MTMNEDWLKDIHDRLADYEVDEPDGLWSGLQAQLPQVATSPHTRRTKRRFALWTMCATVAAAAAVALFFVLPRVQSDRATTVLATSAHTKRPQPANAMSPSSSESSTTISLATSSAVIAAAGRPAAHSAVRSETRHEAQTTASWSGTAHIEASNATSEETKATTEGSDDAPTKTASAKSSSKSSALPKLAASHGTTTLLAHQESRTTGTPRFAIGVFGTGGSLTSEVNDAQGFLAGSLSDAEDTESDVPMVDIIESYQENDTRPVAKHKHPIRFGLTLSYRLTDRLSLETGVAYTRLVSDLNYGSGSYYLTGRQTLHYVGIPIALRTRVIGFSRFDTYVTAGLQADMRIAGREERDYVLDNASWAKESVRIKSHPVQLSVGAAVGVQYNFSHAVAAYAEPGLSYYFDDCSAIESIYKEKPLNFSLNLGLRFSF